MKVDKRMDFKWGYYLAGFILSLIGFVGLGLRLGWGPAVFVWAMCQGFALQRYAAFGVTLRDTIGNK